VAVKKPEHGNTLLRGELSWEQKKKLNQANILGCFLLAGLIGGATQSWGVFVITLAVLLLTAFHAGDIRR
jgi:hypothetical protein